MGPRSVVPVFDIGQVLVRWEPRRGLAPFFPDAPSLDRFIAETNFSRWHAEQDAGRSVAEAIDDAHRRFPHYAHVIAGFYDNYGDSLPGEVPGTRAIFEGLGARGPVYGISNFSRELFDRTVPDYPFLGAFTGLVLSGDEKLNKPDPRIYRILCERYDLDPARLVFIDDSPGNVEAARAMGMAGIVFTDAPSLCAALRDLGLSW
ncbi:MAG: HAD family phosphatase [Rhizobiales bacterium]|nr:HAD family phosphatase [Hyphomicrobiales bacterium]